MLRFLFLIPICLVFSSISAQKFMTREGVIAFRGETILETIDPVSNQAGSVIDFEGGSLVVQVLQKSFRFRKALMEEHYNENYVHSDKYPRAVFKGNFSEKIDFRTPGTYAIKLSGTMEMHGVSRPISTLAEIIVQPDGKLSLESVFTISPEDYNIKIPGNVRDKIAEIFEVRMKAVYQPVQK
ncbi:MAG: YceI family protein [Flavobacteriales bacterium]|nr:MAG: YceI family protein [Flavobacteriales bacterium]